jgi:dTDP-4-dehydrorhamnose reductase
MDALIIGASGMIGSEIISRFQREGISTAGTYRNSPTDGATIRLNKADRSAVASVVSDVRPDLIIDTAAFHDVDSCELNQRKAWKINATGTRNVAIAADNVGARLVYLSTDYVFPGYPGDAPYVESDSVKPANYYARSKYVGEQATAIVDRSTILRTSVVYGTTGCNFLYWLEGKLKENEKVDVVRDQISTPTYVTDLAETCLRIHRTGLTGLFHAAGPESMSRYELAQRFARARGYDVGRIKPIPTEDLDQLAPRPQNSSLDSTTLYDELDYTFHDPEAAFKKMDR